VRLPVLKNLSEAIVSKLRFIEGRALARRRAGITSDLGSPVEKIPFRTDAADGSVHAAAKGGDPVMDQPAKKIVIKHADGVVLILLAGYLALAVVGIFDAVIVPIAAIAQRIGGVIAVRIDLGSQEIAGGNATVRERGDTRQHGAVQASDALWAIEKYGRLTVAELNEIRRQDPARGRNDAERQQIAEYKRAVQDAADGDTLSSFDRLDGMGAVVECAFANQQEQLSRHYLELAKSGDSALVVSPTWGEIHRVNDEVREGLKAAGLIGSEEWQVTAHQGQDLSDAQKCDERYYGDNAVIVFNQSVKGAPKGTIGSLVTLVDDALIVEAAGKIRSIPFKHVDRLTVCERKELRLSSGDRLQLKASAKDANGKRLDNGELVTVKRVEKSGRIELEDGRFLPTQYRQFVRGYAVTSYASQGKTVDHVLFSDSCIKAATNARQWYVTISRGQLGVKIFTTDKKQLRKNVVVLGRSELALDIVNGKPASAMQPSAAHSRSRRKAWRQRIMESIRRSQVVALIRAMKITQAESQQITPAKRQQIHSSIKP
jgi:hypothetical protein